MKLIGQRFGERRIILPTWDIGLSVSLREKLIYGKVELRFEKKQFPEDKFELPETVVFETETLSFPFKESVTLQFRFRFYRHKEKILTNSKITISKASLNRNIL